MGTNKCRQRFVPPISTTEAYLHYLVLNKVEKYSKIHFFTGELKVLSCTQTSTSAAGFHTDAQMFPELAPLKLSSTGVKNATPSLPAFCARCYEMCRVCKNKKTPHSLPFVSHDSKRLHKQENPHIQTVPGQNSLVVGWPANVATEACGKCRGIVSIEHKL